MSRKKTTSHDEKMELVVEFFIEHPEPYQLKELEKAIPKAKPQISTINVLKFELTPRRVSSS